MGREGWLLGHQIDEQQPVGANLFAKNRTANKDAAYAPAIRE
jgi:hypothetical protein